MASTSADAPRTLAERRASEERFWDRVYREGGGEQRFEGATGEAYFRTLFGRSAAPGREDDRVAGLRILSIGGGVDRLALELAREGAHVTTIDVSEAACERTWALARQEGLSDRVRVLRQAAEEMAFEAEFDQVASKACLHHIDPDLALPRIRRALRPGGELIAVEPLCLSPVVQWVHRNLPYHPQTEVTPGERMLDRRDLRLLRQHFDELELRYFELLSRPLVTLLLGRAGLAPLIPALQRLDRAILPRVPALGALCQMVVLRARVGGSLTEA